MRIQGWVGSLLSVALARAWDPERSCQPGWSATLSQSADPCHSWYILLLAQRGVLEPPEPPPGYASEILGSDCGYVSSQATSLLLLLNIQPWCLASTTKPPTPSPYTLTVHSPTNLSTTQLSLLFALARDPDLTQYIDT